MSAQAVSSLHSTDSSSHIHLVRFCSYDLHRFLSSSVPYPSKSSSHISSTFDSRHQSDPLSNRVYSSFLWTLLRQLRLDPSVPTKPILQRFYPGTPPTSLPRDPSDSSSSSSFNSSSFSPSNRPEGLPIALMQRLLSNRFCRSFSFDAIHTLLMSTDQQPHFELFNMASFTPSVLEALSAFEFTRHSQSLRFYVLLSSTPGRPSLGAPARSAFNIHKLRSLSGPIASAATSMTPAPEPLSAISSSLNMTPASVSLLTIGSSSSSVTASFDAVASSASVLGTDSSQSVSVSSGPSISASSLSLLPVSISLITSDELDQSPEATEGATDEPPSKGGNTSLIEMYEALSIIGARPELVCSEDEHLSCSTQL